MYKYFPLVVIHVFRCLLITSYPKVLEFVYFNPFKVGNLKTSVQKYEQIGLGLLSILRFYTLFFLMGQISNYILFVKMSHI